MASIVRNEYNENLDIIATGGVLHGYQVLELLKLKVNAIGIVTAFAFQGPYAIYRITREFLTIVWKFLKVK